MLRLLKELYFLKNSKQIKGLVAHQNSKKDYCKLKTCEQSAGTEKDVKMESEPMKIQG